MEVAPIREKPRLKWRRRFRSVPGAPLLARPTALVCSTPTETLIVDPDDGEVRHHLESIEPRALAGSVLLAKHKTRLRAHDLHDGALLHETTTYTLSFDVILAKGVLVTAAPSRVQGFSFEDPTRKPTRLWGYSATFDTNRKGRFVFVSVSGDVVLVPQNGDVTFLDLRTGAFRKRLPGVYALADERGLLFVEEDRFVLRDLQGDVMGTVERDGILEALGPSVVVISQGGCPLILERGTGEVLQRIGQSTGFAAVARGTVYVVSGTDSFTSSGSRDRLHGISTTGEGGWEIDLGPLLESPVVRLAVGTRRIFGTTRAGDVFCLEE